MSLSSSSESLTPMIRSSRLSVGRLALAIASALVLAATGMVTMIGPQIMLTVPLALIAGAVLAIRRSAWAFVCLGYPLVFGLFSAWIGFMEIAGYAQSRSFAVSVIVGVLGLGLMSLGFAKNKTTPPSKEVGV